MNIEFSSNCGAIWSTIALSIPAVEGMFNWQTPELTSDNCLIRITDTTFQFMQIVREATFSVHQENTIPEKVTGLQISIYDSNVTISWNAVTQSTSGSLISPDCYIVLFSDDPYKDIADYTVLSTTTETSFIHENCVSSSSSLFYRVKAVIE